MVEGAKRPGTAPAHRPGGAAQARGVRLEPGAAAPVARPGRAAAALLRLPLVADHAGVPAQPNQSLAHGLACLQALAAADGPVGSRELARRLGYEPTRVNRLLGTLADLGLAERTPERRYRPGPAIHVLAVQSLHASRLLPALLDELPALAHRDLRVAVGVLWRDRVCYLWHGPATGGAGLGHRDLYPAADSSIGLVLLAAGVAPPPPGIARRELAEIRRQGWCLRRGGTDTASLGVPIGAHPVAGLAYAGRIAVREAPRLAARLAEGAARIAAALAASRAAP